MRRILAQEDEVPVRFAAPTQEQVESPREERAEAKTSSGKNALPPKKSENASAGGGRALRAGLLIFGSLGIFSLIVPTVTGVPLNEWFKGVDFKAAYGGQNLAYIRGSVALKWGNRAAATDILLGLDPRSSEAHDLAGVLFPKLLEAEEYGRAVRISRHLTANTPDPNVAVKPEDIGRSLLERYGLEKAVMLVRYYPDLASMKLELLPHLFTVRIGSTKNLPALKEAAATLTDMELGAVLDAMAMTAMTQEESEEIWTSSERVSQPLQTSVRQKAILGMASRDPESTLEKLNKLDSSVQSDTIRVRAAIAISMNAPKLLPQALAGIKNQEQRDLALKGIANGKGVTETLALVQQQVTPEVKLDTLGMLAQRLSGVEVMRLLLPRMAAIARKSPALIERHDKLLLEMIRGNLDKNVQKGYLDAMLDPATKAASYQQWEAGKLRFTNGGQINSP